MHKYRDARREIESSRKIAWVTKQASNDSPMGKSMQMRIATPRPTGKIPGMGSIAKNPFNAIQKVKVPCPPSVPTGEKTAGYSHDYYMRNRQKIKQRNREYRMRNAAKLRLARQRYNREIKSGARRKAKRIRSGTQYITYGGF